MSDGRWLQQDLYDRAIRALPIVCVDLVVLHGDKVLMVRRKNEPLAGHWWLPGGRVFISESRLSAAVRKLHEECGLVVKATDFAQKRTHEIVIERKDGSTAHSLTTVFWVDVGLGNDAPPTVTLDSQSSEFSWRAPAAWLIDETARLHPWLQHRLVELRQGGEQ